MRLIFLVANNAWAFAFGDSLVRMGDGPMFFTMRRDAVAAASLKGLAVTEHNEVALVI